MERLKTHYSITHVRRVDERTPMVPDKKKKIKQNLQEVKELRDNVLELSNEVEEKLEQQLKNLKEPGSRQPNPIAGTSHSTPPPPYSQAEKETMQPKSSNDEMMTHYSIKRIRTVVELTPSAPQSELTPSAPPSAPDKAEKLQEVEQDLQEVRRLRDRLVQLANEVEEKLEQQLKKLKEPRSKLQPDGLKSTPPLPDSTPIKEVLQPKPQSSATPTGSSSSLRLPDSPTKKEQDIENPDPKADDGQVEPEKSDQNPPSDNSKIAEESKKDPSRPERLNKIEAPTDHPLEKGVDPKLPKKSEKTDTPVGRSYPPLSGPPPHLVDELVTRFHNLEQTANATMENMEREQIDILEKIEALKNKK